MFFALIRYPIMADPLSESEARFRALRTYQVTVRSLPAQGECKAIHYFYRQPGWVRMEFIEPYRGIVLIYDPHERRVRLWPFGVSHVPMLNLAPDNPLLGGRGHRVDRSDIGALLANLQTLRARGRMSMLGDAPIAGKAAMGIEIFGDEGVNLDGVHRYRVWLAQDSLFPVQVESFAAGDAPIETVNMDDVGIDIEFPEGFFTP